MKKKLAKTTGNQVYELMNAIHILSRSSLLFQNAIAERMKLNVTDAECIDFLMEMGPSTAGDLSRVTRLTTGAITNVIDRLEKAGFVQREKDPDDRRKVIVTFIPKKHEQMKKYYEPMAKDVYTFCKGYGKKDLKFLISHTSSINDIYQKHMQSLIE